MRLLALLLTVVMFGSIEISSDRAMRRAADSFLAALTSAQKLQACQVYDSPARTSWMYVPGKRPGVAWADLSASQRTRGQELLRAALSDSGYDKVERIRLLEDTLREMENNPGRDKDAYWFVFFGEPDAQKPWSWRYEGHHLSLTFTMSGGKVQSTTPQFLGTNPAEVRSGPSKGRRVLAKEQDLGYALIDSLDSTQLKEAIVSPTPPADILTTNKRRAEIVGCFGLPKSKMSATQRAALLALVASHADVQVEAIQKARMDRAKEEDLVFAWMGATDRGKPHYYRVQGRTFLIEFDNTQNDGNHIHAVWRDFEGDFGEDALREHYQHGHTHSHQ
jgi:hypothetical protein